MGGCRTDPHSQRGLECRRTFIPFAPFSGNTRIEQIRPYHQPRHSYQSLPALRKTMKNSRSVMSDETPTRDRNFVFVICASSNVFSMFGREPQQWGSNCSQILRFQTCYVSGKLSLCGWIGRETCYISSRPAFAQKPKWSAGLTLMEYFPWGLSSCLNTFLLHMYTYIWIQRQRWTSGCNWASVKTNACRWSCTTLLEWPLRRLWVKGAWRTGYIYIYIYSSPVYSKPRLSI